MIALAHPEERTPPAWVVWLVGTLLLGYLAMGRSFAHLGFSPIYVGEAALGLLVLARHGLVVRLWVGGMVQSSSFGAAAWAVFVYLAFGLVQALRGAATRGNEPVVALQNFAVNIYPLYFFAGLWAGTRHPDTLVRLLRMLAWGIGVYGTAYVLFLNRWEMSEEERWSTEVSWFGQPSGAGVPLLGLLLFERNLARCWPVLFLDGLVFAGMQMRAAWLGLIAALPVWAFLAGRLGQLVKIVGVTAAALVLAALTDVRMPAPMTRGVGSELSARGLLARTVAIFSADAAAAFTDADSAHEFSANVSWRTEWWRALWRRMHETDAEALVGMGYGYPIWAHHPDLPSDVPLRTPHSIIFFSLAYTGWVGLLLFGTVQLALLGVAWRVYRRTGQLFGLCCWIMIIAWAAGDSFFETPSGAVPFYLLQGLAASPLLAPSCDPAGQAEGQPQEAP